MPPTSSFEPTPTTPAADETPLPATTVAAWDLLAADLSRRLEHDDPFALAVLDDLSRRLAPSTGAPPAASATPVADRWPVTARRFARLHAYALQRVRDGGRPEPYVLAVEAVARLRTGAWNPAQPSPRAPSTPPDASSTSTSLRWSGTRRSSAVGARSAGSSSSSSSAA